MTHKNCHWLFGRGASIACGLGWSVPQGWYTEIRDEETRERAVDRITDAIREEMQGITENCEPYNQLLRLLEERTRENILHNFHTTNWDFLLQRQPLLNQSPKPGWLATTAVRHLNGSVKEGLNPEYVSQILLETDEAHRRTPTPEANTAYNDIMWGQFFIIVGMSFACDTDKDFLAALNRGEDDMPIGEADVFIVNPDREEADSVATYVKSALPNANVSGVYQSLGDWVELNMPELVEMGILNPSPP